jgi:predicted amidohydrolase
MSGTLNAAILQLRVTMDIAANLATLTRLLTFLPPHSLAVAPEGTLSGYRPQPGFVEGIDQAATQEAIAETAMLCQRQRLHLIAGACVHDDGVWRNRSIYFGPNGERTRYDKINLAHSERGDFTPGSTLPVFDIEIEGKPVRLGVQMCREIRYPEQWRVLAEQGAQIIAYVNNAVGSTTGDSVWRAHMISRAAEIQRFVIGANNAAPNQTCPSMIVAPTGAIIAEAPTGVEASETRTIDLDDVSNWNISQARIDVIDVALRDPEPS